MAYDKEEAKMSLGVEDKTDTSIQGEGGGGFLGNCYDNPALTTSVSTITLDDGSTGKRISRSNEFVLIDDHRLSDTSSSGIQSVLPWTKKKAQSVCSRKTLYKRLPILRWLPAYDTTCAVGDLVAGVTVGITVIPQALAYATIANVPSQYGLYTSFLGCLIYIVIGGSKDVPVGPTAIVSLVTYEALRGKGQQHATLLCFLAGIIQLLMGVFGLGFLIDFVSGPVSSGFTSAGALIIVTSQVKDILGVKGSGSTFIQSWTTIFQDIHNTRPWDAGLGVSCIVVLLIMRIVSTMKLGPKDDECGELSKFQKIANKCIWLFGTARNAILVIVSGFIGYSFCQNGEPPFRVVGYIPPGLPKLQLPPFGFEEVVEINNGTNTTEITIFHSFGEMIADLGSGIVVVPLVGLLETIAICKAFGNGRPIDATQEFLAIGICNICNSFVQAFPGGGSLSRSPVNNSSGVRTPLGGLYTGFLVIVALLFLTPWFYYIPKCTLAAIIIAAVVFMVEVKVVRPMWRSKKSDLVLCITTFVACLCLPLQIGILIGIGINLVFILYHAARPKISIEKLRTRAGTEYLMLTPDRCLIFPSTDYVRNLVTKHSIRQGIPVVIDCSYIYGADYTAATVVESLTHDFASRNQPLFFYNLKPSVSSVFEGLSPKDFVVFYRHNDIDELLKNRVNDKRKDTVERV